MSGPARPRRRWRVAVAAAATLVAGPAPASPPNVLFIMVDDLNNMVNAFGYPTAVTPNIDRLAGRSVVFQRAYCQLTWCNPSRTSMLSGLRPWATGVYNNYVPARRAMPDRRFLPQHFRLNGYYTAGVGKIFHRSPGFNDPLSWDENHWPPGLGIAPEQIRRQLTISGYRGVRPGVLRVIEAEIGDNGQMDGTVGEKGAELLGELGAGDDPFFLAVGFTLPHLPWVAPAKYFDNYEASQIPLSPVLPIEEQGEIVNLNQHPGIPAVPDELRREAIRAYLASLSYVDALVGKLLAKLDEGDLWDDTVIVFCSDHGFMLGEHGSAWEKVWMFEECIKCPLMIRVPGAGGNGQACGRIVELLDIFPTLVDYCELPDPGVLHGVSLRPLLEDPGAEWDRPAITEREASRSIRTERWHYIEWWRDMPAQLYDHDADPHELRNLAGDPAYAAVIEELRGRFPPEVDAEVQLIHPRGTSGRPDRDGDGLPDMDELDVYGTPMLVADADGDGLSDGEEVDIGSSPLKVDTDGDGLEDGLEVNISKTSPILADTDGDGLDDPFELDSANSDPTLWDTDGDGLDDGVESRLAGLFGFDPSVPDPEKVAALRSEQAGITGLFAPAPRGGLQVRREGGELVLSAPVTVGLERSADLRLWEALPDNPAGLDDGELFWRVAIDFSEDRFFRLAPRTAGE